MKLFLRISLLLTLCISVNSFIVLNQNAELKKDEAQKAFEYLNEMRANPAAYSDEVGIKLSAYEKRPALVWNPILAEVAEKKAADMANRNYFSHQTPEGEGINVMIHDAGYELKEKWYSDKSKNYF
ncbi:MAG: CAP domain-containing protein, partial [Flavobacteriales bacterium]|nr:CAP domain-containing protein [Flavobacteriales bacterium]